MAIQNRQTTLPGIWAENAQTTIPTPPVAGVTYRDTTLNSTAIDKAWPFKTIVDSSDFNQHAFLQDTLIKEAEQYGIMRWNNTTAYKEGGFCLGQDGKLYQAKRDNQGKEPTANKDDWDIFSPDLSPYQLKSNLSQTIDGSTSKYPSNKAVQSAISNIDLSAKANTSLNNITATGKQTAVAWGMPDYSAGISGKSPYTAPKDGFFVASILVSGTGTTIKVDNKDVILAGSSGGTTVEVGCPVPISKGSVVNGSVRNSNVTFYPMKGVN